MNINLNKIDKVERNLAYKGTNRSMIPGLTSIKRGYNNWRANRAGKGTEKLLRGIGVGKNTAKLIGNTHSRINAFKRNNSQVINTTKKVVNTVRNNADQAAHVNDQRQAMAVQQQANAQNRAINQQQAQQRFSLISYHNKSFSSISSSTANRIKDIILICGITTAIRFIPKLIKVFVDRYGTKNLDLILSRRNSRYEKLSDNYKESNAIDTTKTEEYKKELHALIGDSIRLNKSNSKDKTVYGLYIMPFLAVLSLVLIKGVFILHGTEDLKKDREDFQLVYCPNATDIKDVLRTPFRQVLFKYKWPAHGFKVSTIGAPEANKLISYTVDFLAEHPQYLAIRV